jgi:ribosomal protein S19
MEPRVKSHRLESVAAILEREVDSTIKEWTRQVSLIPSLTNVLLSDEDRTGHLPQLFNEAAGG